MVLWPGDPYSKIAHRVGQMARTMDPDQRRRPRYGPTVDVASNPNWSSRSWSTFQRDIATIFGTRERDGTPRPRNRRAVPPGSRGVAPSPWVSHGPLSPDRSEPVPQRPGFMRYGVNPDWMGKFGPGMPGSRSGVGFSRSYSEPTDDEQFLNDDQSTVQEAGILGDWTDWTDAFTNAAEKVGRWYYNLDQAIGQDEEFDSEGNKINSYEEYEKGLPFGVAAKEGGPLDNLSGGSKTALEALSGAWHHVAAVPALIDNALENEREAAKDGNFLDPIQADVEFFGNIGEEWDKAYDDVVHHGQSPGRSLLEIGWYQGILGESEEQIEWRRKHDPVYNLSSGALDFLAAWKAAPEVLGARGVGTAVRAYRGHIPRSWNGYSPIRGNFRKGVLKQIQKELGKQDITIGKNPPELAGALYGHELSGRIQMLRSVADKVHKKELPFDRFAGLKGLKDSTHGPATARALVLASQDDELWELTLRSTFGDADAYRRIEAYTRDATAGGRFEELHSRFPEAQTWLDAMDANKSFIKALDDDIVRTEKAILDRGPSGMEGNATKPADFFRYNTWLMETDVAWKKTRLAEAEAQMARYEGYNDWLDSTMGNTLNSMDTTSSRNAIAKLMEAGPNDSHGVYGFFHDSLIARRARFDGGHYGKSHEFIKMNRAPWLKKPGILDLNNVPEGYKGMSAYFDQLQAVTGWSDPLERSNNLFRFAGLKSPTERNQFLANFENEVVAKAFAKKYNVEPKAIQMVLENLAPKRKVLFDSMQQDMKGSRFTHLDDDGHLVTIEMPFDRTELKNYYLTWDVQQLDNALALDTEFINTLDTALKANYRKTVESLKDMGDSILSGYQSLWKPAVLLRAGWIPRVMFDEGARTAAQVAMFPFIKEINKSLGLKSMGVARHGIARAWYGGKNYNVGPGPLTDEANPIDLVGRNFEVNLSASDSVGAKPLMPTVGHASPGRQAQIEKMSSIREVQGGPRPWNEGYRREIDVAKRNNSGFTFDPASDHVARKGWAVQAYTDRTTMVPDDHFGPHYLNWFAGKHSDVLGQKGNRIAVSHQDGLWRIDVVKYFHEKNLQKALEYGQAAEADGIVDVGGRFNTFVREEPFTDSELPLMAQRDLPNMDPYGPERSAVDDAVELNDLGVNPDIPAPKKMRGWLEAPALTETRAHQWVDANGKRVKYDGMYSEEGRVYIGLNSGTPMAQRLAQGTLMTGRRFNNRAATFETIAPPEIQGRGDFRDFLTMPKQSHQARKRYYDAWLEAVNTNFRFSPIWRKMMAGQSDDDLLTWFRTAEGKQVLRDMPYAPNPQKQVMLHRRILDWYLPSKHLQAKAATEDLTLRDLVEGIRYNERPVIRANEIESVGGAQRGLNVARRTRDTLFKWIAGMPIDNFVRHPYAATLYNMKMQNFIASNTFKEADDVAMKAAQREARAFANRQIKRTLYNLADDSNFMHSFRFVFPFLNAQYETMIRWARITNDHPESLVHMMQVWDMTNDIDEMYGIDGYVVPADQPQPGREKGSVWRLGRFDYGPKDEIFLKVPGWFADGVNNIPYLKGAMRNVTGVSFTKGALNPVLQGQEDSNVFLPGFGPHISLTVDKFFDLTSDKGLRHSDEWWYKYLFPIGRPSDTADDLMSFLPGYGRKVAQFARKDADRTYHHLFLRNGDLLNKAYVDGRGPKPTIKMIRRITDQQMKLRIGISFITPVQLQYHGPDKFFLDQMRKLYERHGPQQGHEMFIKKFGLEHARFAESLSDNQFGLPATKKGFLQTEKFKDLMDKFPNLASLIVSPDAYKAPFNQDVYDYQFNQQIHPGNPKSTVRTPQSYQERERNIAVSTGWDYYLNMSAAVDARMHAMGINSLLDSEAEDLANYKDEYTDRLAKLYPAWAEDYMEGLVSNPSPWLEGPNAPMRKIAFDDRMDNRPDMQGLRQYIIGRDRMSRWLTERRNTSEFGSENLQSTEDPQIEAARKYWNGYVFQLKENNPMFADLYNRWLSNDTLEYGGGI